MVYLQGEASKIEMAATTPQDEAVAHRFGEDDRSQTLPIFGRLMPRNRSSGTDSQAGKLVWGKEYKGLEFDSQATSLCVSLGMRQMHQEVLRSASGSLWIAE